MNNPKFLELLKRGTNEIIPEQELVEKLSHNKPLRIKLGVDPTTPDLHLGHTVQLRKLRLFQDFGHTVILIIGDFTAHIGDPSGQDKTRPMLTKEIIKKNAQTYQKQVFKILDKEKTEIVYNSQWLQPLGIDGLLKLCSKYTVARMLERDDFSKRFKDNNPITIIEFIYPLLQGYDSVAIKSDVEIGGTDQKFNLLVGRELQRDAGQEPQVIITSELLVGTDGVKKMSKTYGNYIAFTDTPKDMYGKVMSLPDNIMYIYYEALTDFDLKEVKKHIQDNPRDTKAKLAFELTKQYYDENTAKKAQDEFDKVFSRKELPEDILEFKTKNKEYRLVDLLIDTKLVKSKNEARRLISQGAVQINNKKVTSDNKIVIEKETIIKAGKRRFCKILNVATDKHG